MAFIVVRLHYLRRCEIINGYACKCLGAVGSVM